MDAATHDIADRGMPRDAAHGIARAFLPASRWGNRYHYHYVQAKLRTDPLYPRVVAELRDGEWPLLDLGCGLGLLVHALRGDGQRQPYLGVDMDTAKLQRATRASVLAGLAGVRFAQHELARDPLPAHLGAVALLDVLQYLPASAQHALLAQAVARLAPGAPLVIRVPLARDRARSRFTRLADHIGHRHFPAVGSVLLAPIGRGGDGIAIHSQLMIGVGDGSARVGAHPSGQYHRRRRGGGGQQNDPAKRSCRGGGLRPQGARHKRPFSSRRSGV